jgi:hypothetical protein
MSIFQLLAALVGAMVLASVAGAVMESAIGLLVSRIPPEKLELLRQMSAVTASRGQRLPRFYIAQLAPGMGHVIAVAGLTKDFIMFGGLGLMNAIAINKFLMNPDRIDLVWYAVGILNFTPLMPREKAETIPGSIRIMTLVVYVSASVILFFARR